MVNVSNLVQDDKGFIWLAGQSGLTRFDGNQTINFSSSNPAWPVPFNWIHDVAIDIDKHALLIATETNGVWRFNPETGECYEIVTNIKRKSIYNITSFQGNYYIYAPDQLFQYQINNQKTSLIKANINITSMVHNNSRLYVSGNDGLYQLYNGQLEPLIAEPILTSVALSSGVISITQTHIYFIDNQGNKTQKEIAQRIYAVAKEHGSDHFFTVSNQGEINKYSGANLQQVPHKYGELAPVRVRSILHDNSGVLWIVSSQGILQLTEKSIKNTEKIFDISINANEIGIYNDEVIIGSYGAGLQNYSANIFTKNVNTPFSKQGLKITDVETVDNQLYIATFDGVWTLNKNSRQVKKLDFPDNNKLILKIEYKNDKLYFGSNHNGVYIYDIKKQILIDHINLEHGLSSTEVIDMLPLNNGTTWLATSTGIDIVNNDTKSTKNLNIPTTSKVISLIEADNKIFASTLGHGIYAFDKNGDLLNQFGQGNRFSHMTQVKNEVWVAGRPGLYRFNPNNYQLSMIENTEQYSFVGSQVMLNNVVYASHYGGVLSLDLTPKEQFNAKVYISKTTISGKSYLLNKSISIKSGNDVITLDLASLDFRPGPEKKFRYRLNSGHWNQINGNQLTLTGLASGQYNIEIMATNSLGQWSNFKAYTEINVDFPWYWQPQMRLLYAIILFCLIGLTAWLLYLRSKSISHVHDILKNDLSNHSTMCLQVKRYLTLTENLIDQGELEKSKQLLKQCFNDLNGHQSSLEPNTLDGKTLSLAIPFLATYLQHKYHVNLTYQVKIKDEELNYELQSDLYRVIFEAITSVLLKESGRNFKLVIQLFKGKVWLNIYDDGRGFINFNSKINFDISMYYIQQIANKYNGSINTFNENGNGSQLVLSVPLPHIND